MHPPTAALSPEALLASITDPTAPGPPSAVDRLADAVFGPLLVDARDVVFGRLIAQVVTQVFPLALLLFVVPSPWACVAGPAYVAFVFARFAGPVMLGLHAVTHRPLFRKPHAWAAKLVTHLFPPFWGLAPFAYNAHHVQMHHTENNGNDDISGTAEYQRDSPLHFAHYWLRFFAFGYLHLGSWMRRRNRKGLALVLLGDACSYAAIGALAVWKPAAAFFVFILPFLLMRFFMMAGNWTEHAFVDVDAPDNSYRNSTCLLNTPYNHRCFNAGYHLVHHLVPGRHWADTPAAFARYLPKMIEQDAIVFSGVRNNQQIWWKLMRGDYDFLAERLVDIGNRRPSHAERVEFLRSRVQRRRGALKGLVERREAAANPAAAAA